jgi:hypothetical protein
MTVQQNNELNLNQRASPSEMVDDDTNKPLGASNNGNATHASNKGVANKPSPLP